MIKNIKIQIIFLFGCLILMNSCAEDEGNYDYIEINEVVFEGILEEYTAPRFDNLVITTDDVKFTIDTEGSGAYEYSWEAVSENFIDKEIYKLSSDKNMDTQIVLLPGEYSLYYLIKDLNTDVVWQHKTKLTVINSIYEGWMVLNDVGGEARLDMVSLLEGEYKEIHDVLSFSQSPLTLSGKPGFVQGPPCGTCTPKTAARSQYAVWRSRHLPSTSFACRRFWGAHSLPQTNVSLRRTSS